MVGHRWRTTKFHWLPVAAHHTDDQRIAGGQLARPTLFAGGEPRWSIHGHQWQIPLSDCRLCATGGSPGSVRPNTYKRC